MEVVSQLPQERPLNFRIIINSLLFLHLPTFLARALQLQIASASSLLLQQQLGYLADHQHKLQHTLQRLFFKQRLEDQETKPLPCLCLLVKVAPP